MKKYFAKRGEDTIQKVIAGMKMEINRPNDLIKSMDNRQERPETRDRLNMELKYVPKGSGEYNQFVRRITDVMDQENGEYTKN